MTMTMTTDSDGTKICKNKEDLLHRTDGPAVEYVDGTKEWYQNGQLHRTDGPAIEYISGTKYWYQNGRLHRTDGPAMDLADGTRYWYQNGMLLRATVMIDGALVIV